MDLVHVAAGDPPRALELYARDAAGNEVKRRVWLRGPHPAERGPDTSAVKRIEETLTRSMTHPPATSSFRRRSLLFLPGALRV